jgi:hypothetical protein
MMVFHKFPLARGLRCVGVWSSRGSEVLMYGAGSSWLRSLGRTLRLGASTSSIGRCFWYDLRAREQVGTHDDEQEVEAALKEKGLYEATVFTTTGPAGVFALYAPAGAPLGNVFFNEFVVVRVPSASESYC